MAERKRVISHQAMQKWLKSSRQGSYAHKYPRVDVPLTNDELPARVVERAQEIASENPYLNARKYYMDVTGAQWAAIQEFVYARDGGVCVYCGQSAKHIDHSLPISLFGSWHPDNCVAACESCNCSKGNLTPEQWSDRREERK